MVVRIVRSKSPEPRMRNGRMRRAFIYPHRSVRSLRLTASRIIIALLTAAVLTALVATQEGRLVTAHYRISQTLVQWAGIPVNGTAITALFPLLAPAPAPVVPSSELDKHPLRLLILFLAGMLALLQIHRSVALARGFVVFLMILLLLADAVILFHPSSQFGSVEFSQIWMRGEVLVWLLLPWFSAAMFVLIHPLFGVAWTVLTQVYGFLWSAVRLAFSLCLIHYSGILFVPILWFALGLLADMVYLVVFYSIAVQWASNRAWGRRES